MFEEIKNTLEIIKSNILAIGKVFGIIFDLLGFIGIQVLILLLITSFLVRFLGLIAPINKKVNYFFGVGISIFLAIRAKIAFNPILIKYILIILIPFIVSSGTIIFKKIFFKISKNFDFSYYLYTFKKLISRKKIYFLSKEDIVDIVFTSSNPTGNDLEKIKSFISSLGLRARIFDEEKLKIIDNNEEIELDDFFKATQLHNAMTTKDSKILWAYSGDTDSSDLIPYLNEMKKTKIQKIFIGNNDCTTIENYLMEHCKYISLYAPTLKEIVSNEILAENYRNEFNKIFFNNNKKTFKISLKLINPVSNFKNISGKIIGGSLQSLITSLGTKNAIKPSSKILFLEGTNSENKYLLKYFKQIKDYIIDNNAIPKAILLGSFVNKKEENPNNTYFNKSLEKLTEKLNSLKIDIPIYYSIDLGIKFSDNPLFLNSEFYIYKENTSIIMEYKI